MPGSPNVVGALLLILLVTSKNVERSLWLLLNTADTLRALKVVRANGRVIGVRTRRKNLREALVCWIAFVVAQPISLLADALLAWFPFYRSIKSLIILACAYWRLESSALFYQIVVGPLFKRRERQIDLTLSLLHATSGIVYYLLVELPWSFILGSFSWLPLWPFNARSTVGGVPTGSASDTPRAAVRCRDSQSASPAPGPGAVESEPPSTRRDPALSRISKLPEWPPPKRSVYSEDLPAKPSRPKPPARSNVPATVRSRVDAKGLPADKPAIARRTVSGASRTSTRGEGTLDGQTKVKPRAVRGNTVEQTVAAKLKSLPPPPSVIPGDPRPPAATASRKDPPNTSTPNDPNAQARVTTRKRLREDSEDDTPVPNKRRVQRKPATATKKSDVEESDRGRSIPLRRSVRKATTATGVQGRQQPSKTATSAKPRAASVSVATKRTRVAESKGSDAPPKRTRSVRSAAGKKP